MAVLSFLTVAAGLLWRNATLFTTRVYEVGDAAANSLLVNDAQAFSLLVGHYSRVGFNHPGPAVLYLQAAGEALFTDVLGITPGPYNGQAVALLLLQAAVVAAVVGIVFSWTRRWPVAVAALAACLLWYEGHTHAISSTWMPHVVVAPFLLLIVSAASVAAGRVRHLWLLAASAGLLVHAHVEFALFAPVLVLAALATWAVSERRGPLGLWRCGPRSWLAALGIVGAFVAPIALNTVLNWPGEVPKYLGYSSEQAAQSPTLLEALHYARQFWTPDSPIAKYVPLALVAAAAVAARSAPRALRRPLGTLVGAAVLAEALFVLYALVGIDDLNQDYIGLFSWSVPLALILVLTVAGTARLSGPRPLALGVAALSGVLVVWAFLGDGMRQRSEGMAGLPAVQQQVEQAAEGRRVILDIGPGAGPFIDGTSLLVHLERAGRPACAINRETAVQLTAQRICLPREQADGVLFELRESGSRPGRSFAGMTSDISVVGSPTG